MATRRSSAPVRAAPAMSRSASASAAGGSSDEGPAMPDALGWRMKFGVIAPSTNTIVQPEFDAMRPAGVTNHFGRIHIPNDPLRGDDDFTRLIETVRREIMSAIDRVMTCEPGHLIMGMSSETFWDGLDGSERLKERVEARAGVKVTMGSDAARQALAA